MSDNTEKRFLESKKIAFFKGNITAYFTVAFSYTTVKYINNVQFQEILEKNPISGLEYLVLGYFPSAFFPLILSGFLPALIPFVLGIIYFSRKKIKNASKLSHVTNVAYLGSLLWFSISFIYLLVLEYNSPGRF